MALTGVDPNDPIPSTRRELIFGAGPGSTGVFRDVVLLGNKTSAGSETDDTFGVAIADDLDCRTRFGIRSEIRVEQDNGVIDTFKAADAFGIDTVNDNTRLGENALNSITLGSGIDNTAIGSEALTALTTGDENTVVGDKAGDALTTGSNNTIVGSGAGSLLVTVSGATAVGKDALAVSTAAGNTAVEVKTFQWR